MLIIILSKIVINVGNLMLPTGRSQADELLFTHRHIKPHLTV